MLQALLGTTIIEVHGRKSLSSGSQVVSEKSPSDSSEDERRELEAIAATLGNSSRLLRLITYIGEKYFQGETDKLREYNIATEVFGRSRSTFNAGEDAIVRVEAHRLRKRMKEYYEGEGKDHLIHVSIPAGSYVPVFTRRSDASAKLDETTVPAWTGVRWWKSAAVITSLALLILAGYWVFRTYSAKRHAAVATPAVHQAAPLNGASYARVPLRILAGYSGKPQIDSAGETWGPDRYFQYGGTWDRPNGSVARTSDPMLFEHWRNGDFSYKVPLRPGVYELHLYFISADPNASTPPTFSVSVNGTVLLPGFDVSSDAMGPNTADERIFRDISPAADGFLHLAFASERSTAALNAIEILPGLPHRQLPIRIVMQPTSFTDHKGNEWHPDDYYLGGYTAKRHLEISGTPDSDLYDGERYGNFTYAIPVDTRDRYTLILHFAESYFGPNASGVGGIGSRVFRVLCNGNTLLDNFDIYKEVGSLHALTKTFYHLKPTPQGKLNITFEPIVNNATVSAIEVLDEGQ